jgi:RimJ/RimL family protein N-acetyltransferase
MGRFRDVELDDVELAGERLELRRWQAADAGRVHAVMQNPVMREFLALPDPYTSEAATGFVTDVGHEGRGEGTGLGSAIVERETGRVVGACALRLRGDPEIGYWVAPDAQGHGYATEATRLLCEWGFGLGLPRVRLVCDVRNLASARTALSAGFRFEGIGRDGVTSGRGEDPRYRGDLARFARLTSDPADAVPPSFAAVPGGTLDDGVVRLRPLQPTDAPGLAEADDSLTVGWNFTGTGRTSEEIRHAADTAGLDWLVGTTAVFAMVDVASGRFAGTLDLRRAGPPQVGGIGYVVHPAFRGRGFTMRALRLLVPWAFEAAGFARLELGAKSANVASQRAAAAAGFEPDGTRQARLRNPDGTFSDEVCFALVNPRHRS